ncbi:MAG: DUF3618 domain-containing protein [Rhodobacteraceae bacterium]|nr:DUF3618 domain-containing protein [Paracoccaceae bacterium]
MSETVTEPHDKSVRELERDVNETRASVSRTIDELQSRASMGNIVDQVVSAIGENGGEMSRNLGRTLRDNPLPALLTGVGLAWLMAGGGGPRLHGRDTGEDWGDRNTDHALSTYGRGSTLRPARTHAPDPSGDPSYLGSRGADAARPGMVPPTGGAGGQDDTAFSRAGNAAKDAASRVGSGASDMADSIRSGARNLSDGVRDQVSGAGNTLNDAGLAAQARAGEMRDRAMAAGRRDLDRVNDAMQEQPLVFGALAMALGAAIGGALPSTRAEDRLLGEKSDQLKAYARQVVETEGAKVQATAGAVAQEAVKIADEAAGRLDRETPGGRDAVERAEAGLRSTAGRLADAGREEAERQKLGESVGLDVKKTET